MSSTSGHRRVAIIGGGISGLAAAFRLRELAAALEFPLETALFEKGPTLGRALATVRHDGFVIETGADSFLSEKPWALELAKRLGLESELIKTDERFRKTLVVRAGRLAEIPEGFSLLAPTRFLPVFRSPLFSVPGKLRMALEPLIPARREGGDESLASFVTRRLGREVLDRVAQPLAGGIYTADPELLSLAATMPRFIEMERRYGSLYKGLRAASRNSTVRARGTSGARWSLFLSFRGGMRALVEALATRLGESVRTGTAVAGLARADGGAGGWRVEMPEGAGFDADAVIVATPAYDAARLLKPHDAELARLLDEIDYSSAASVNLAYRAAELPRLPESFGFVVPVTERRKIIACTFSSVKFAHRAPEGTVLMRTFLGGALQAEMMGLDDAALVAAAREEIAALLGVRAEPIFAHVQRWPQQMPQYAVGHLDRVARIERRTATLRGLALAGAAYRGVGVPDCIHSGEQAAESILYYLQSASRA
ncbi:MAG: protoporphyrinogen oxidase [Candidatus Binatus sp.]